MLAMTIATLALFSLPAFADSIKHDFGVSSAEVGLLTAVFAAVYALVQVPAGVFGDVVGHNVALSCALALLGASLLASTQASSFAILVGLRALTGLSAGVLLPVTSSLIRAAAPRHNTRAQAMLGAGWGLGYLLSLLVLPVLFSSWRQALVALTAVSVLAALVAALLPSNRHPAAAAAFADARAGLRSTGTWLLGGLMFGLTFANVGVGAWAIPFCTDDLGLSKQAAGLMTSLIAAGVFPAAIAGAAVAQRRSVTVVAVLSAFGMATAVVTLVFSPPLALVGVAFFVLGWCAAFPFGVTLGLIGTLVGGPGGRAQGALAGAVNGIAFLAGMVSPPIVGLIYDASGSFAVAFAPLVLGPVLALATALAISARLDGRPA
jgi:predicted MFS family arabinose efflux permease